MSRPRISGPVSRSKLVLASDAMEPVEFSLDVGVTVQAVLDQLKLKVRSLLALSSAPFFLQKAEAGTQGFMPEDNAIQCPLQSAFIQRACKKHTEVDMVGLAHSYYVCQEPQPLLSKRKRDLFSTWGNANRRKHFVRGAS